MELTAILRIIAIVIWVLAAFFQSNMIGMKVGGQDEMVALGPAVWLLSRHVEHRLRRL